MAEQGSKPRAAREDSGEAAHRNRALGVLRLAVVWTAAAALAWFGRPSREEWIAGIALAFLGESLRVWAAGYLVKTKELITGGPYRFVRNPLYLGRLLILSGVAVAAPPDAGTGLPRWANLAFLGVGAAIFFFFYLPRKERTEPRRLEKLHGDPYRRYFEAVPSIVPRLTPYDEPRGAWKWANFGKNEEIFMVLFLSAFFAVVAYHSTLFAG